MISCLKDGYFICVSAPSKYFGECSVSMETNGQSYKNKTLVLMTHYFVRLYRSLGLSELSAALALNNLATLSACVQPV